MSRADCVKISWNIDLLSNEIDMKKTDTFSFGPWKITTAKGAILKAGDVDR